MNNKVRRYNIAYKRTFCSKWMHNTKYNLDKIKILVYEYIHIPILRTPRFVYIHFIFIYWWDCVHFFPFFLYHIHAFVCAIVSRGWYIRAMKIIFKYRIAQKMLNSNWFKQAAHMYICKMCFNMSSPGACKIPRCSFYWWI